MRQPSSRFWSHLAHVMPEGATLCGMPTAKDVAPKRAKPGDKASAGAIGAWPKTSAQKLVEQAGGLEAMARLAPILRLFGRRGRDAATVLQDARSIASQARELTSLPGRFNAALGSRGWIAYERMNHELLRLSTGLAEGGRFEDAEALLVDALDAASLRFQLDSMVAVAAYRPRADLLLLAAEDFHAGRYHAVVPVVLAQIDGIVADVAGQALFTKTKDFLPKLIAWDSISAQEGGLPDLVELMAAPRYETTAGPIEVPYRHGILHGRDLGYATKIVAVKAWAALFSLREWAIKYEQGEASPPPVEPAPSLKDTLRKLADVERQRQQIIAWQPRSNISIPKLGIEPAADSPEAAAMAWLHAWKERHFAAMSSWTQVRRQEREPQLASALEATFGSRELRGFTITRITDVAAALTEVTAELTFEGPESSVLMTANVVFEDKQGQPLVRGTGPGRWGVNEISAMRQVPITHHADVEPQA